MAVVGKGIETQIDIMIRAQVLAARLKGTKVDPVSRDAVRAQVRFPLSRNVRFGPRGPLSTDRLYGLGDWP